MAAETSDLPVGAVVLLRDGAENSLDGSGDLALETMNALRNRRLPVHTVGFGKEQAAHDVEVDDVSVASRAMADSRMAATVSFHQRGYAGSKATLVVRDGDKTLASRDVTLGADGAMQTETVFFNAGDAGVKSLQFVAWRRWRVRRMWRTMRVTRLVGVSDDKRRILYVEGEPRWEYKFIRRAEDDDKSVQVVSMLRTTENKIYRQGISDPKELADGFPVRAEDLFQYQGIIIGLGGGGILYALAAGVDAGVCGPARRWGAVPGRAVFAGGWRMGRRRAWRICCRRFCPTAGTRFIAIRLRRS